MKVVLIVLAVLASAVGHGDDGDIALRKALTSGAVAEFQLKVVDEEKVPVVGARVEFGFWNSYLSGGFKNYILKTDASGMCVVKGQCNGRCVWNVQKKGYYPSGAEWHLSRTEANPKVKEGRWQPYGELREIVLKKIRQPGKNVPFSEKLRDKAIPALGVWLGFDLERGDWLPPYGTGVKNDVLLRLRAEERDFRHEFNYMIEASFTNNAFAGGYILPKDACSDFKTIHHADPDAKYVPMFVFEESFSSSKGKVSTLLDSDSYLVFRTRTEVDKSGRLVSAHYGKISGRWIMDARWMELSDGCFNPIPNDTNLEDSRTLRYVLKNLNRND